MLTAGAGCLWADKVDVTSQYISNPNFEGTAAITTEYKTYHKDVADGGVSGLIAINGWIPQNPAGDAHAGGPVTYGSSVKVSGQNAPSKPDGGANETALGVVSTWGADAQYLSDAVTLPAGDYTVTVKYYNTTSGTIKANYFGFKESGGTTHYGSNKAFTTTATWTTEVVEFTLASETTGQFSVGLAMDGGNGSAVHLFLDNIKVEYDGAGHTAPSLGLRADVGESISLDNFIPAASNYTLEVEGTIGTPIIIAGAGINYTPTTNATVRFAKADGSVYVYEGTDFIGVIAAGTPAFSPNIFTIATAGGANNKLQNGDFSTVGDKLADNKYKFGTPWTSNREEGSSGVRINQSGSLYRMCWRGKGDSKYFGQPITGLKPNRTYQASVCQVDQGNGWADFNIGIGAAAGGIELASSKFTLGRKGSSGDDQYAYKGVWYTTFTTPSTIEEATTYYFTFANTNNGSHTDALTQLEWIALAEMEAQPITGVSSAKYTADGAFRPATPKDAYDDAKTTAIAARDNASYNVVTGSERETLIGYINADEPTTTEGYNTAAANLTSATNALINAAPHYQALIDAQAAVPNLAYASTSASAFKTAVATSASDADAKVASMTTDIRAYYESHALAEGVACPINRTSAIANPDAMNANNGWTWEGTKNDPKNNEPWTDASGSTSHWYFDGGNWNGSSWTTTMRQTITLPAGTYLLTAKGRAATNTTLTMGVGGESVELPHVGSSGNVFNRGWGDASVEFTADGSDVEILVTATSSTVHEWFSIGDFRLVRIDATAAEASDYTALSDAITAAAHTLGFEDGQYAPYTNAEALTYIAKGNAVNPSINNAKDEINALTTAITNASWTANSGDVDAIYNQDFSEGGWTPTAWSSTGWAAKVDDINSSSSISKTGKGWRPNTGTITYGNTGVYTMPLVGNQLYKLTFKYGAWDSWSVPTISVLNAEDGLAATELPGTNTNYKTAMNTWTMYFKTGAAGNYILSMNATYNMVYTDVSLVKADAAETTLSSGTVANNTFFQELTLGGRTFSNEKWNTLCVPFDFPTSTFAEVKVLDAITVAGDNASMSFVDAGETVTAGTPCLVKASSADYALVLNNVKVNASTTAGSTAKEDGTPTTTVTYVGTFTSVALTDANSNAWVVSNNQLWNVDSDVTVGAYRAYFTVDVPSGGDVKSLSFDELVDGIKTIDNGKLTIDNGEIFNLAGQKMSKLQRGVNIVNGKKVLVK